MEYIEGDTFYNYCDARQLSLRDRLKLFQKVCSAIEYDHDRQIVHRDIKPSNTVPTINREWRLAKAWLYSQIAVEG